MTRARLKAQPLSTVEKKWLGAVVTWEDFATRAILTGQVWSLSINPSAVHVVTSGRLAEVPIYELTVASSRDEQLELVA